MEKYKKMEVRMMKNMLAYKINVLKKISQNFHSSYTSLQGAEYQGSEALSLLSPLLTKWGPYIPFFDRLVPILTQKKELPYSHKEGDK